MTLASLLSVLWIAGCGEYVAVDVALEAGIVQPADATRSVRDDSRLRMHNTHTGEALDVAFRVHGEPYPNGIAELNHLLRDYRTGDDAHYPIAEFDLLHALMQRLGRPSGIIEIICGYRTPQTNEYLRTRSSNTGVAEASQHTLSQAIDIRVPGVSTLRLRDAALALGLGGVGYYPQSQFVHVDVGPVREWSFGAGRVLRASHKRSHGHGSFEYGVARGE